MNTALLMALFFSGLQPDRQVFVRVIEKMGGPRPLATLYALDEKGHCTAIPVANPTTSDNQGRLAFCANVHSLRLALDVAKPGSRRP